MPTQLQKIAFGAMIFSNVILKNEHSRLWGTAVLSSSLAILLFEPSRYLIHYIAEKISSNPREKRSVENASQPPRTSALDRLALAIQHIRNADARG